MAMHDYQVLMLNDSGLPRDHAVNILHYDTLLPETVAGTVADIVAAYQTLGTILNTAYTNVTVKAYNPEGGAPIETLTGPVDFNGGFGPLEQALCLSYSADDNVAGAPRRRGRIYLPCTGASTRPSLTLRNQLLDFGEKLAQIGTADATTWHMLSRVGSGTALAPVPVYRKIESISVDDEWDTQRRRGLRATSRIRRDVQ